MNELSTLFLGYWNARNTNILDSFCLGKRGFASKADRWSNSGRVRKNKRNKTPQIHH